MADTLRDLAYGAALRGQMPAPPMPLPDTIARLAMQQGGSVGTPYRTTLADMVGRGGAAAQRLAQALDTVGVRVPGTQARISLKDLTLGDAGQVVEDWSYGSPPMRGGNYATGGMGTLGPTQQAMELFNLGGVAGGTVKGAQVGARVLGPTLKEMVREGGESFMRNIGAQQDLITWHGSPHTFDRFDSSKIGTGEGAQAYGHGLYLAESPDVAKSYTKVGDARKVAEIKRGSETFAPTNKQEMLARNAIADNAGDIGRALLWLDESRGMKYATWNDSDIDAAKNIVQELSFNRPENLYKVDLPDSMIARMLDWDKPLSAQPMASQNTMSKIFGNDVIDDGTDKLHKLFGVWDAKDLSGERLYMELQRRKSGRAAANLPDAARILREEGIPGIRYLDGGSRADGLGTSNFVVFPGEESALTILERNGRPLR